MKRQVTITLLSLRMLKKNAARLANTVDILVLQNSELKESVLGDKIVNHLLSSNLYIDVEGVLYGVPIDCGNSF